MQHSNVPLHDAALLSALHRAQWSIWFEFFLLLVMLVTCFLNAFERARFIYLTYLALVTSLLTITSRNFINATVQSFVDNGGTITIRDTKQSANNASAAGAIMLCITNYALIIFIGICESCLWVSTMHFCKGLAEHRTLALWRIVEVILPCNVLSPVQRRPHHSKQAWPWQRQSRSMHLPTFKQLDAEQQLVASAASDCLRWKQSARLRCFAL